MKIFCDLHLHSCLSPCGDEENTVGNLVGGKCGDLYGLAPVIRFTQMLMVVSLLGTFFFVSIPWLSVLLMFVGTACLFAVSPPQQLLLLQNSRGSEMMGAA